VDRTRGVAAGTTQRAEALGVDVRHDATDHAPTFDSDLGVASEGAGSELRQQRAEHFGTQTRLGRNR
jgi:hypothetical protein